MIFRIALVLLFLSAPAAAQDAPLKLKFPVACTVGTDCWIVRYPNTAAAGTDPKDFKCGGLTEPDSTGTDIALRDALAMNKGVDVLAVADGKITNVRDDIDDAPADDEQVKSLRAQKKACGNGILIDHGNGWQSIYCHLKKASIKVKKGDDVKTGAVIAQIGQSGAVQTPAIHISLFHNGKTVDPFTGHETGNGCGEEGKSLWPADSGLSYQDTAIYGAGFTGGAPDFSVIKSNSTSPASLSAGDLNTLSFWSGIMGAQPGDKLSLEIMRPDGTALVRKDFVQKEARTRQFYYIGKKLKPGQLTPGDYTGKATLTHTGPDGGETSKSAVKTITIN